jgi:hypothetical protein
MGIRLGCGDVVGVVVGVVVVWVCVCVCVCVSVCVCVMYVCVFCGCMWVCVCVYVCVYLCICVFVCRGRHVYGYVCMCACVCVCVCVCVFSYPRYPRIESFGYSSSWPCGGSEETPKCFQNIGSANEAACVTSCTNTAHYENTSSGTGGALDTGKCTLRECASRTATERLVRRGCGMWNVECEMWNVECEMWNVECGIWSVRL